MTGCERPPWCPDETCLCLGNFLSMDNEAEGFCVGRMEEKQTHPGTIYYNTHNWCNGPESNWQVNDADLYYIYKLALEARRDVSANKLYRPPGFGETYDLRKSGDEW